MATSPDRIESLKNTLRFLIEFDIEKKLVKTDRYRKDAPTEIKDDLETLRSIYSVIKEYDYKGLPAETFVALEQRIGTLYQMYFQLDQYDGRNHPKPKRELLTDFDNAYKLAFPILLEVLVLSISSGSGAGEMEIRQRKTLEEAIRAKDEIDLLVTNVKSNLKTIGVSTHQNIFQIQSDKHFFAAKNLVNGYIIIYYHSCFMGLHVLDLEPPKDSSTAFVVQFTFTKILIASILIYFITLCSKNYKSEKHNQTLNKHRQNALMTFETFSNGTSDEQTKNAILLEATHSIFANQNTGYSSVETEPDLSNKFIEIIKTGKQ